jgi:acyl-CoA synthetase (AMP-forming)/AMP-acid ligase II
MVRDAVAMGVEDPRLGQRIVLIASPAGEALDTEKLLAELRNQLPLYMVPSDVIVRAELPRSPNNKFDRNLLRQQLAA